MSVHQEQIASVLTRAVQAILSKGLNDPRVRGLVSVTQVKVSTDLANATVFVSVLPEEHANLTMHGLRHAARHIRTRAGDTIRIRRMPELSFKLDGTLKKEAEVLAAISAANARTPAVSEPDLSETDLCETDLSESDPPESAESDPRDSDACSLDTSAASGAAEAAITDPSPEEPEK